MAFPACITRGEGQGRMERGRETLSPKSSFQRAHLRIIQEKGSRHALPLAPKNMHGTAEGGFRLGVEDWDRQREEGPTTLEPPASDVGCCRGHTCILSFSI